MEYIGYVKYQGPHIKDGLFGARDAAIALNGFDEVFRYFLIKEDPEFSTLKFDLPIKIEEGSWGIFTPEAIEHLMYVAAGSTIGYCTLKKYFTTVAEIAAKDGILQSGPAKDIKAIFQKTFQVIQWMIRLVSHMKDFRKKFDHAKLKDAKIVAITNDDGEVLEVPLEILMLMEKCPKNLFSKLASIVSASQELEIGVNNAGNIETVRITETTRRFFYVGDEKEKILPELIDGEEVTLTGVVTRANESSQSIGFQYNGHILTCKPQTGKTLADFKNLLISQNHKYLYVPFMDLTGIVERKNPKGEEKERIRIFFSQLEPNDVPDENEPKTPDLFE